MLQNTTAIVLGLQPLSDRSCILFTYTRAYGRANYIIYGAHSRLKGASQYTPMSMVELTYRVKPNSDIQIVESSRLIYVPQRLPLDVRRQAVALFLSEVLLQTLVHPMQDEPLFEGLQTTILELDQCDDPENVHLRFLLRMAEFLGFAIDEADHPTWFQRPSSRAERQVLLRQLCGYFALHIDAWRVPKSLDILTEIFD